MHTFVIPQERKENFLGKLMINILSHSIWNFSLWCVIKSFSTVNFIGLHKKIDYRMKIQI